MRRAIVLAALVVAAAAVPAALVLSRPSSAGADGVQTVDIGVHHSHFSTGDIHVKAGTTVRFVVHNDDPILHELIVGPPDVQQRHEAGTEPRHAPRAGEITIDPLETAETTYTFATPGSVEYACQLPGHHAYGMTGQVIVDP